MTISIRRLGPGDEALLAQLALDDADFDLDDRSEPGVPLSPEMARRYLANPAVLHWVAFDGENPVGFLFCLWVPLRSGVGQELLLYEIGVRQAWRRQSVGRALMAQMENWMRENGIEEVWVLADNPGAVAFYEACQFGIEEEQPTYMTRELAD